MAEEKKIYTWPVQLRENLVTEDTNDYVATVKTFTVTKTLDDILNAIVDEGTEYKKETLQGIYLRIERKIRETVCSGYPVTTDNARLPLLFRVRSTRMAKFLKAARRNVESTSSRQTR